MSFCDKNIRLIIGAYKLFQNPWSEYYFYNSIFNLKTTNTKKELKKYIKKNWKEIKNHVKLTKNICIRIKENKQLERTSVGFFTAMIEKHLIKIKSANSFVTELYKILEYPHLYNAVKDLLFILSNNKRCKYLVNPQINHQSLKKKELNDIINTYGQQLNTLKEIITGVYPGEINDWGHRDYATAYSMYKTLMIMDKFYNNPLLKLNIKIKIIKKTLKKNIGYTLLKNYQLKKYTNKNLITKKDNMQTVSEYIVKLKHLGYDLWFTIPLVFESIYPEYNITNVEIATVVGKNNRAYQRRNNLIGIMAYYLVLNGFITNIYLFRHFNN